MTKEEMHKVHLHQLRKALSNFQKFVDKVEEGKIDILSLNYQEETNISDAFVDIPVDEIYLRVEHQDYFAKGVKKDEPKAT